MELKELIVVSGKPGIFKMSTQTKAGLLVEDLFTNKKFPIQNVHNISSLKDIAIYTEDGEVPLSTIFKTIYTKEKGKATISHKVDKKELLGFFTEILPNYDTDRVYPSNIKKIVQWYNILVETKLDFVNIDKEEISNEEE